jgi:uncharacterized protein YqjF (DUF2071 family)
MARVFLTAEWRNLIIASFHAPEALLRPRLPRGLDLDLIDGAPTVSLVAFQFLNTRVMGVRWPGFVNFPEWNLRFYVKENRDARRGVVFIREFVPSRVVSRIARSLYNEPYYAAPLTHRHDTPAGHVRHRYSVRFGGAEHSMEVTATDRLHTPHDSTTEHLLKEHQWGYGTSRRGECLRYEVTHPTWRIHEATPPLDAKINVDWTRLYGPEWGVMQDMKPFSVVLAEGSAITVAFADKG